MGFFEVNEKTRFFERNELPEREIGRKQEECGPPQLQEERESQRR